jgi:nucleoside-diphosphate-sugar epimerase
MASPPQFARFHFRGHWDSDGTQMLASIRKAANNPSISVKSMPWWLFRVGSAFNETLKELSATRPLWRNPIELDISLLVAFLGKEPHTPLDEAIATTLRGLGSL